MPEARLPALPSYNSVVPQNPAIATELFIADSATYIRLSYEVGEPRLTIKIDEVDASLDRERATTIRDFIDRWLAAPVVTSTPRSSRPQ
jgi:hypothetical protein